MDEANENEAETHEKDEDLEENDDGNIGYKKVYTFKPNLYSD